MPKKKTTRKKTRSKDGFCSADTKKMVSKIKSLLGNKAAAYLSRTVDDKEHLEELQADARNFQVGTEAVPVSLLDNLVYDIGGSQPNESVVVAPVDRVSSDTLEKYLNRTFRNTINQNNSFLLFVDIRKRNPNLSGKLKKEAFRRWQFVLVISYTLDTRKGECLVMAHRLDRGGCETMCMQNTSVENNPKKLKKSLDELLTDPSLRAAGQYNTVLQQEKGDWSIRRLDKIGMVACPKMRDGLGRILGQSFTDVYNVGKEVAKEKASAMLEALKNQALESAMPKACFHTSSSGALTDSPGVGTDPPDIIIPDSESDPPPQDLYGPPRRGGPFSEVCNCEQTEGICIMCCIGMFSLGLGAIGGVIAAMASICPTIPFPGNLICAAIFGVIIGAMLVTNSYFFGQCLDNCTRVASPSQCGN